MREEEEPSWFARCEEQLPRPDELMPLSQTLITPDLAVALDIQTHGDGSGPLLLRIHGQGHPRGQNEGRCRCCCLLRQRCGGRGMHQQRCYGRNLKNSSGTATTSARCGEEIASIGFICRCVSIEEGETFAKKGRPIELSESLPRKRT